MSSFCLLLAEVYDQSIVYESQNGNSVGYEVDGACKISHDRKRAGEYSEGQLFIPAVIIIVEHRNDVLYVCYGVSHERSGSQRLELPARPAEKLKNAARAS